MSADLAPPFPHPPAAPKGEAGSGGSWRHGITNPLHGAFRTDFGGLNQVIGEKGSSRLAVGGPVEFPKLDALWQKVGEGL